MSTYETEGEERKGDEGKRDKTISSTEFYQPYRVDRQGRDRKHDNTHTLIIGASQSFLIGCEGVYKSRTNTNG